MILFRHTSRSILTRFFQSVTVSELDRLLGLVVDVENLFMCVHKEEDGDTKQVYYFLFKLLRKSILQASKPTVEGPLVCCHSYQQVFFISFKMKFSFFLNYTTFRFLWFVGMLFVK